MSTVIFNEGVTFKLIEALYNRDIKKLNEAIVGGAPINSCLDKHHLTPLHYAAILNFREAISPLIQAGADITARTDIETRLLTPEQTANLFGHYSIEKMLVQHNQYYVAKDKIKMSYKVRLFRLLRGLVV